MNSKQKTSTIVWTSFFLRRKIARRCRKKIAVLTGSKMSIAVYYAHMKFYEEHATFHHFKHNPHKWFAAILISPLHHAEMRYKQTYHLRFAHAKKLFVFDMMLILSKTNNFFA